MIGVTVRHFSAEQVQRAIVQPQLKLKPIHLVTEFGDLLNLRPLSKLCSVPDDSSVKKELRQVHMINDNTDVKSLIKKMDHNPRDFFLFDPQAHYFNSLSIYKGVKKALTRKYYGREREKTKKDWQKIEDDEKNTIHSWRGTPFDKCEIPYDLFHLNRRSKLTIKQELSRLGYLTLRDGTLEVQGEKPECKNLKTLTLEMEGLYARASRYEKPDFFTPFPVMEGIVSSEALEKSGIQIHCLDSKVIYPMYGVWTPTTQEYLSLLANYVSQKKSHYSRFNTMVDLGSGTGVLPLVLCEKGGFGSSSKGKIISIDSYPRAVQATKLNTQIFGHASSHTAIETDIVDLYFSATRPNLANELNFYKNTAHELGLPFTVDLIVCNPPWIPATHLPETSPLDNAVYDTPEQHFLKSALNFARIHLDKEGEMLLVYSDLGYQLGLLQEDNVQRLATGYGLRAELIDSTQIPLNKKSWDPLRQIKHNSKVQLFRVTK